jgi:hypothetical protein
MSRNPFSEEFTNMAETALNKSRNDEGSSSTTEKLDQAPVSVPIDAILPLQTLCENGKNELMEILMSLRGRKCLVIEPQLGGLLNIILPDGGKVSQSYT